MKLEERAIESQQVLSYLARLDAHLLNVPRRVRTLLRAQIGAQLDEAVRHSTSEAELAAAIGRLGEPSEIVAEALTVGNYLRDKRVVRHWWRRVGRKFWLALAAGLVLLGTAAGFAISVAETAPLSSFSDAPWYSWAMKHARSRQLLGYSAVITPMKNRKWVGIYLSLDNDTDWAQTVVRVALPSYIVFWPKGPRLAFASSPNVDNGGSPLRGQRWHHGAPYTIPPHSIRGLLIGWQMDACEFSPGSYFGMNSIPLRVRVGWFTRTENVQLSREYVFQASKKYSSSASPACRS